ncbi:MAG: hypothetical protein GWN84_07175 [Gammaproteobacteria bacterium]|nr:hypothetical protein [Gammaproteobacteria bacterium]NIR82668.1 hypothetical protein [Gammaproteobacteria bacterium]NIR89375.1 hypothetical protein [Gammaproteobacteria bacterium]NIU03816.1 hypothetical protein [Gammaproteobacteria bacterium]NIV51150.1 hypothetical protein [Gammaproteobacteria bacterium]
MRLVIEGEDFRRLSPETQRDLMKLLTGTNYVEAPELPRKTRYRLREPIDLTPELTAKLMHGLADDHRRRLELFARNDGRASMQELLKLTNDTDWHVLSYFQSVVTRKLRRLLPDGGKAVQLIGWDYNSTQWDAEHTQIVDGTYYVTGESATCLRSYFHL